ncbi:nucleotide exchange factor GrpE [Mycoplasmopsis opalescens]|uniref:nucleotide exchange factor GrpE n=1 Tax=Mycoplasmopsis opalescens TaxID=114886 RepID=UPI0004A75611|nr:nucleotide exchange factor GrpE [Mycoplasmopsis opalescens]
MNINEFKFFNEGDEIIYTLIVENPKNKKEYKKYSNSDCHLILGNKVTWQEKIISENLINTELKETITLKIMMPSDFEIKAWQNHEIIFKIKITNFTPKSVLGLIKENLLQESQIKKTENILSEMSAKRNSMLKEQAVLEVKLEGLKNELEIKKNVFEKELLNVKKHGLQKYFEEFIPTYSTLQRAVISGLQSNNKDVKNYVMGFTMVLKMIENVFARFGLVEIEPNIGSEFNPELHKVLNVKNDKTVGDNIIIEVNDKGYKLNDRVIKYADVTINRNV